MCEGLNIQLNLFQSETAVVSLLARGELPRLALSACKIALSEQAHPDQDIVATGWLGTCQSQERLKKYEVWLEEARTALIFFKPEKSQVPVSDSIESANDHGADMIVTPCPLYQDDNNRTHNTGIDTPVVDYSQLMSVACGHSAKNAGLNVQIVKPGKLVDIAGK